MAPDAPTFSYDSQPTDNGLANLRLNWLPDRNGRSGSHFFAKYREQGQSQWLSTDHETHEDFLYIRGMDPDRTYEVRVISVDGAHMTESHSQMVYVSRNGECLLLNT